MLPQDKFGRRIRDSIFQELYVIGTRLERLGYQESASEPNMFFKKINNVTFYADMRGTSEVPIWEEPKPLFYFFAQKNTQADKKTVVEEWKSLIESGCRPRRSFYDNFEPHEGYLLVDEICEVCGKRYYVTEPNREGCCSFECSEKLHEAILAEEWSRAEKKAARKVCAGCGRNPTIFKDDYGYPRIETFDKHHVDYRNNETVRVCKQCHGRITRKDLKLEHLFPIGTPKDLPKKPRKQANKTSKPPRATYTFRRRQKAPDLSKLWLDLREKTCAETGTE